VKVDIERFEYVVDESEGSRFVIHYGIGKPRAEFDRPTGKLAVLELDLDPVRAAEDEFPVEAAIRKLVGSLEEAVRRALS
jgi:hypothetical protein